MKVLAGRFQRRFTSAVPCSQLCYGQVPVKPAVSLCPRFLARVSRLAPVSGHYYFRQNSEEMLAGRYSGCRGRQSPVANRTYPGTQDSPLNYCALTAHACLLSTPQHR